MFNWSARNFLPETIFSVHSGSKNTIIGCIYRHPKGNLDKFAEQLDELLQYLNQSKYQVILVGDFNIDFFQIITHQSTEKYLDMLFSNNFFPINYQAYSDNKSF